MAKRDWRTYNEQLKKRGEFYINPRFLHNWNNEIKGLNHGKVGNPFLYPTSMIEFLAVLHSKSFDYRALEGIMRALSKNIAPFPVISYTQIYRRINALDIDFDYDAAHKVVVGCDGTGIKVSNRGEWIRHKWKVKRGWIKVVIMGSTDGRVIDVRIGDEVLDERAAGRSMLKKNGKKIKKAIFDGLHDCNATFNLCNQLDIEPVIKIRKNARTKTGGYRKTNIRRKEVRRYKELGYERWSKLSGYGLRWPASEGIFSSVKGIFGESVRATKKQNMYKEAKMKFWAYNQLLEAGSKSAT